MTTLLILEDGGPVNEMSISNGFPDPQQIQERGLQFLHKVIEIGEQSFDHTS